MRLFCQAVQAVTVELLGVLLIVWLLFGFASWGFRSALGGTEPWRRSVIVAEVPRIALDHRDQQAAMVRQRTAFVARRLDRYGHMLDAATKNVWRRAWANADM